MFPRLGRWRAATLESLGGVEDLVRVLMKRRNGGAWSEADRVFLREGLRHAGRRAPLLLLLAVPGGLLLLPACAWLLDRRRARRG